MAASFTAECRLLLPLNGVPRLSEAMCGDPGIYTRGYAIEMAGAV